MMHAYFVLLNSLSICTVDDIDEGLKQILCEYLVHDTRLAKAGTVNNNYASLE